MADVLEMLHRIDRKLDRILERKVEPKPRPPKAQLTAQPNGHIADAPMTIEQFCEWADISVRHYYRQRKLGLAPRVMRMGHRTARISREEALAWAARMTEKEPT